MCIHPDVSRERDGKVVDARCHALVAPHVRQRHADDNSVPVCDFYEQFDARGRDLVLPTGAYNLDDLKQFSKARGKNRHEIL